MVAKSGMKRQYQPDESKELQIMGIFHGAGQPRVGASLLGTT